MQILKLTPVASTVIEMFGSVAPDVLHEMEFNREVLVFRIRNRIFNEMRAVANFTKGLEVSPYFSLFPGYEGTYLN